MKTRKLKSLFVIGTRPEAIKLAPVIHECRREANDIESIICLTGQHREMVDQMMSYFGLVADVDLDLMQAGQSLPELTARMLIGLDQVLKEVAPDCVVAQGDTSTVFVSALAAFYRKLPFVHIEAGLRTKNILSPWPEEMHRCVVSLVTAIHCSPSSNAAKNLLEQGISPETIHVTGNTVIDALYWTLSRERRADSPWPDKYASWGRRRVVLITGHRRENLGVGIEGVCRAVHQLAELLPDVVFVYPVHPNPAVMQSAARLLAGHPNVHLMEPAAYPEFVWLMDRSALIISDSGGVQEEAPALGKFVLVTRESTERPEVVEAGAAELVGTDASLIIKRAMEWLSKVCLDRPAVNPYGDGYAAERIVELMLKQVPGKIITDRIDRSDSATVC